MFSDKTFYQHQTKSINALIRFKKQNSRKRGIKGRIVIPTGGGKTLIQQVELDSNLKGGKKIRVHLVLAPRIALLNQLSKEYRKEIGAKYLGISFHSGQTETDYETIQWEEKSTTSLAAINEEIERAKVMKKDLVIFSTYHSAHKLASIKFYTAIADESQYCVQDNFHEVIRTINSKFFWFFTATEKYTSSDQGLGLNNTDVFGKIIDQHTPKELIKTGIIVPPRIHHCQVNGDDIIKEVIEITKIQEKETRTAGMPQVKVLFACSGTNDVQTIYDSISEIQAELPSFDVFTITSKLGVWINNVPVNRTKFLQELNDANNAIIAHYDILSEGIDVRGITGVVLMRNLNQSKLIQTIGRAVRLYNIDNKNIKKFALVSVVTRNNILDNYEFVREVVEMMRMGGYEVNSEDIVETTLGDGTAETEIPDMYGDENNNAHIAANTTLKHFLENEARFEKLFEHVNNHNPDGFNFEF